MTEIIFGQTPDALILQELHIRVTAAIELSRRINIATGLTVVTNDSIHPDMLVFKLQAIAGFTIATVTCSWHPPIGADKGYWRLGRMLSFDMTDLNTAIGK